MAASQWTLGSLKGKLTWATAAAASDAALPDILLISQDVGLTSTTSSSSSSSSPSSSSSSSFQRLPITPPEPLKAERMQTTSPIDIATPTRNASSSPSSQGQKTAKYHGIEDSKTSAMMTSGGLDPNMGRNRQDSFGGAKPISMNNPNRSADARPRRESLAGSLVGGMSWGGVSVGSWVRDDIIMTGTSPFPYQSPSFHSSSYLPKLEAQFMRDFSCCGTTLPTLHDLLHHYEECHAQQTPRTGTSAAQQARNGAQPDSKAAIAAKTASSVQQQSQQKQQQLQGSQTTPIRTGQLAAGQSALTGGIQRMRQQQQAQPATPTQQIAQPALATEDMDGVEDMEMDDAILPMETGPETTPISSQRPAQAQQSLFGQPPRPNLHLTNTNGMIHQGLRSSQPNTPSTAGFGFQNNPTVSSVNTPTLSTQVHQQNQPYQEDDSIPGTPVEDDDFNQMTMNMSLNNMNGLGNMNFSNFGNLGFGNGMNLDLCIDEPAKRLFSPNGFGSQRALQQQFNSGFGGGNSQMGMGTATDQEMLRQLRQAHMMQQMQMQAMGGGNMGGMMMMGEENKPFKCPVMGCEKAYKNQNGLKYHKTHGHQNQQLHENGDGTFSIVNPETSVPYPGTLGMEKEKPYKCEVCGKRYKNLNGLKYHKSHSPPCNPELKLNGHLQAAGLVGLGMGHGLPGIGEEI